MDTGSQVGDITWGGEAMGGPLVQLSLAHSGPQAPACDKLEQARAKKGMLRDGLTAVTDGFTM